MFVKISHREYGFHLINIDSFRVEQLSQHVASFNAMRFDILCQNEKKFDEFFRQKMSIKFATYTLTQWIEEIQRWRAVNFRTNVFTGDRDARVRGSFAWERSRDEIFSLQRNKINIKSEKWAQNENVEFLWNIRDAEAKFNQKLILPPSTAHEYASCKFPSTFLFISSDFLCFLTCVITQKKKWSANGSEKKCRKEVEAILLHFMNDFNCGIAWARWWTKTA